MATLAAVETNTPARKKGQTDRYINLSLKDKSGKSVQVPSIQLTMDNVNHAKWIAALDEDPEAVNRFISALEVSYNDATPQEREFEF